MGGHRTLRIQSHGAPGGLKSLDFRDGCRCDPSRRACANCFEVADHSQDDCHLDLDMAVCERPPELQVQYTTSRYDALRTVPTDELLAKISLASPLAEFPLSPSL